MLQTQAEVGTAVATVRDTVVLEPPGHLGAPLCLPQAVLQEPLLNWGYGEAACGQEPEGGVPSAPVTCISQSPRKKPKKERDLGTEEKNPKCSHGYTESLWQREHLAALNIGISFLLNTSILDPISETGLKP